MRSARAHNPLVQLVTSERRESNYYEARLLWLLIARWRAAKNQLHAGFQLRGVDMAEPSYEELKAKLAELEKQVQGRKKGAIDFRVSEKGGVSVYGLGRFPVTLYYEQWIRLLEQADELRAFLESNKSALKRKNPES